jgi:hypothetical protein
MQGFRAFHSSQQTIQGIETMNMIGKGQVRWLAKGDIAGQVAFVNASSVSPSRTDRQRPSLFTSPLSRLQHCPQAEGITPPLSHKE